MRSFVGPPHLLLLRHAMADHLVHCGLGNAAADRQPFAVIYTGPSGAPVDYQHSRPVQTLIFVR